MHTWGNEELRFATASDSNDAAGMVCIQVTRFRFEGQCSIAILVGYYLSYMNLSQMADITLIALLLAISKQTRGGRSRYSKE